MAEASIPVDLLNPGQVFACLGFLEAAETLLGNAYGGFDWSDESDLRFRLRTDGEDNPFLVVLRTFSQADVVEIEPVSWQGEHANNAVVSEVFPSRVDDHFVDNKWTRTKLPARVSFADDSATIGIDLLGWTDGSSRPEFKLYSGNRTGASIARDMLAGKHGKPTNRLPEGKLETQGLRQLWEADCESLTRDPFAVICPVAGSFNMDPRGGWTAIDSGFSPNEHKTLRVMASPVVEIMAVIGLEHARPDEFDTRKVRYATWCDLLSPILARAALAAVDVGVQLRTFRFNLDLSGKNKVVTFAEPESE